MAKEVSILLKAKSLIGGELKRAEKALNSFAKGAKDIFKAASKVIIGFGGALAGIAIKAVSSYADAEKAVRALSSAHRMFGEDVETLVAKETALASAIQDETGLSDDLMVSRMANLKMLGVQTEQLEAATKGTVALVHAGMGEEMAMKALAAASNGNFEALTRYIPALRTASDQSEKAAIVNDFLTKQYQAQKDELNTVGGQWGALKERVGDAWEAVGQAIAQNETLQTVLKKAGDKVKELTERFQSWAASGGVTNLIAGFKQFGENVRNTFAKIRIYAEGFFKGGLWNPAKAVFNYLGSVIGTYVNVAVTEFTYLKDMVVAVWEKIKNPMKKFEAPDLGPVKAAYGELGKAVKGEYVDEIPNAFTEMFTKLDEEEKKHAANVSKISEQQLETLKNLNVKRVENTVETLEQIKVAEVNHAEEIKKLQEQLKKDREQLAKLQAEEAKNGQEAAIKALQDRINKTEQLINKNKELARQSVQAIIDRRKAEKAAKDAEKKEFEKGLKLQAKADRFAGPLGGKLNKKDAEFLQAWQEKQRAIGAIGKGEKQLGLDKKQLEDMQKAKDSANLQKLAEDMGAVKNKIEAAEKQMTALLTAK